MQLRLLGLTSLLLATSAFGGTRSGSFDVRDYGAAGDGRSKDTAAIARAVAACAAAGGGTVRFPAGRYLTGSIRLESNLTLQLDAGCVLLYSPDPADSPLVPSRWEGTTAWVHAPLIYANGRENVAVTGRGRIDGQGENWWWWAGRDPRRAAELAPARAAWQALYDRIEAGATPTQADFAVAAGCLRPCLVEFNGCRHVLVEGVTITESPMWLLHPLYCEDVDVRGVSFISHGINGDGIDVDSCRDVRVSDCFFDTGDDCIVIKSGRDADGRRVGRPCEFVAVSHCVMYRGHGAVAIGSETAGGVRDVVASNIVSKGTDWGIRIKSMRGRGGVVENVRCDNFVIEADPHAVSSGGRESPAEGIEITTLYGKTAAEPLSERTPVFRNFAFSHITIVNARKAVTVHGLPEKSVEGLRFDDVTAEGAQGFACDHAAGVELRDVRVRASAGPAFQFDAVQGLVRDGVPARP